MEQITLIAITAFGLESVVARELTALGYPDHRTVDGRVIFRADPAAIARCNIRLRSAERILLMVGEFPATDFGQLFDQVKELPWPDFLPVDAEFPVKGRSVKSQLHSVPTCQSITKKAIVESLRGKYNRFRFEEDGPLFPCEVSLLKDRAVLTIDTTGDGLHKRGYRQWIGQAPLKETMAAALVQLSFWHREKPLIDPFCGSGTIPIEAALIGRNRAPGLGREFIAQAWPWLNLKIWQEARDEAQDLMLPKLESPIIATDHDPIILKEARKHASRAGVDGDIHFQESEISNLKSSRKYGCVVCNPPYGERIGERSEVDATYREFGRVMKPLETWSSYVLTSHPKFEQFFDREADRRRKLYNGRIQCTYYQFHGEKPPRSDQDDQPPTDGDE